MKYTIIDQRGTIGYNFIMETCLAFVLGGGGARGAFQVGALKALHEAGLRPDLLVGSSIGAVNAAAIALWGFDETGLFGLELAYHKVAGAGIIDVSLPRFAVQAITGRLTNESRKRAADFLMATGITPDLTFGDLTGPRLGIVGADLAEGQTILYGRDPNGSILEAVLASMAIPPWFAPVERDGHFIMDGGVVSNLPIEAALDMGATEIIALDLEDPNTLPGIDNSLTQLAGRLWYAVGRRVVYLEMELARARNVRVHHLQLRSHAATPVWDFSDVTGLIRTGYEQAWAWIPDELGIGGPKSVSRLDERPE